MDWIRQNNFLATFGGIMLLGFLGLGFFAFSSWNGYSAAIDEFESTRTKLTGLEGAPLHPNPENLQMVKTQVDAYETAVDALFTKLKSAQPPLPAIDDVDVTTFGKKIQTKLAPFQEKAKEREVLLGDNFYMGMDRYRGSQVANEEIAQKLEWALGGIAVLGDLVLESGIDTLNVFKRYEEPWEDPSAKPEPKKETRSRSSRNRRGSRDSPKIKSPSAAAQMADMLESSRVRMRLTGTPDSITNFFNLVSNNKEYHFWIRWAKVANETPSGPSRGKVFNPYPVTDDLDGGAAAEPEETGQGDEEVDGEGTPPAEEETETPQAMIDIFPILGDEKVRADVVIDIVRFRDKPAAETKTN
jgi:hypothetical protein